MANSTADPIVLKNDGREYVVAFTAKSIRLLEKAEGQTFGEIASQIAKQSYTAMYALLRASLLRDQPSVTEQEVDALMESCGWNALDAAIGNALMRDLGSQQPTRPPTPSSGRRGKRSTRTR